MSQQELAKHTPGPMEMPVEPIGRLIFEALKAGPLSITDVVKQVEKPAVNSLINSGYGVDEAGIVSGGIYDSSEMSQVIGGVIWSLINHHYGGFELLTDWKLSLDGSTPIWDLPPRTEKAA